MPKTIERVLETLRAVLPDLVVLVDPEGRIAMFNGACETLTGYRREEALGRNLLDFLVPEEWTDIVQQRFADPFAPEIVMPHESPWLTKSGEQRLISWRCTALNAGEGELPHILGIGTDVTEQRRTEEMARSQARLLERFFESTLSCAVLLDKDFNFIRVNQAYARACRRDVSEFPGRNHFDFYPSDARPLFEEVVRSKRPYVAESRPFQFPDHPEWGVTYWDWTLVPVLDERGEVELLLFCLNGVTERVRAEQNLQDAMDQLRGLSRQLVDIQEQERRRIARELHDEIGQGLTGLKLALENSLGESGHSVDLRLRGALATASELIQGVRRIAFDLRPPMLDDLGLLSALVWLSKKCRAQAGLDVNFRHSGLEVRLPQDIETAVFRISQEALTNVMRHADAPRADVAVWVANDRVVLRIEDKGRGFDPADTHQPGRGAGLLGMHERAALLGGMLTIDTGVGSGTTITVELPTTGKHP
ncbi:MAG: PAS domain-containing protein [Thiobacillus sp.]